MKVCSRCHENKPVAAFYRDPRYRLGVTGWCKPCRAASLRQWADKSRRAPKPVVTTKRCRTCDTVKPGSAFPRNSSAVDGLAGRCKECRRALEAPQRMTSDSARRNHLRGFYGMTIDDLKAMADAQNHACALCFRKWTRPAIDHDHETRAVRGLLCYRCNTQLRAIEDPDFVALAQAYLAHHRAIDTPRFFIRPERVALSRRQKAVATAARQG